MFTYFYKNIVLNREKIDSKNIECTSLSWSENNSYLFIGGSNGYSKINKFNNDIDDEKYLEENFFLNGSHRGDIIISEWNDNYQKLTTCDSLGMMIVWMYNGETYLEEMLNESDKKKIISIKWTEDGTKLAIIIQGGNIIVGTVEGERLWNKDFKIDLSVFSWTPDSSKMLMGTNDGEIKIYDNNGNYLSIFNFSDLFEEKKDDEEIYSLNEKILLIEWRPSCKENSNKSLLVITDKNKILLYDGLSDEIPNFLQEKMIIKCASWSKRNLIAFGGYEDELGRIKLMNFNLNIMKIIDFSKQFPVKTLSIDNKGFNLAVGYNNMFSLIKIKPSIKVCYLKTFDTLVYGIDKENEDITLLCFYNLKTKKIKKKKIQRLCIIKSYNDLCLIIKYKRNCNNIWEISVLNYNGNVIETKEINIEPEFVEINKNNIVIANNFGYIYNWKYRTSNNKSINFEKKNYGKETAFFIENNPDPNYIYSIETFKELNKFATNSITSIGLKLNNLIIGFSNNLIKILNLTNYNYDDQILLNSKPMFFHYNNDLNILAIEDYENNIKFYDLKKHEFFEITLNNCWNFFWGNNDSLCCYIQNNVLTIMEDFNTKIIKKVNTFIIDFSQVEIKLFDYENILDNPEEDPSHFITSLQTFKIKNIFSLFEDSNYNVNLIFEKSKKIKDNKIWDIIGEKFLMKEDFENSKRAYQEGENYPAIKLIEKISKIDNETLKKSEILLFLGKYEEANTLLINSERKDLAIKMWSKIGKHDKTIKLIKEFYDDTEILIKEFENLGDNYYNQLKYKEALKYYKQTKNLEKIMNTAFIAEDYKELSNLLNNVVDKEFLIKLAQKMERAGLIEMAARAYEQGGDYKKGLDICILNNYWGSGVEIAERNRYDQIDNLVIKYAKQLIDKKKNLEAVELYRKANRNTEAAKLLNSIALELVEKRTNPIIIKKVFVLSGLEVNIFNRQLLNPNMTGLTLSNATKTIDTLITSDINSGSDKILSNPWRGAEAWHFFILAQNQFSKKKFKESLKTCFRLQDYELELGINQIYSIFALASYYSGFFQECSKSWIKLENNPDITLEEKKLFGELSLKIFSNNNPTNPNIETFNCPSKNCESIINEYDINCNSCGSNFGVCVASGQSIFIKDYYKCKTCKHKLLFSEINKSRLENCSLCHSVIKINK